MKRIIKRTEPVSLTEYKRLNSSASYENLAGGNESIRVDIRKSCLEEQNYLCAYCCDRISLENTQSHNEHIIPQNSPQGRNITLDYNNIVASCQSRNHCGHKKDNNFISVTPLMSNCERDIIYNINGTMTHRTPDAQSTISTLNLRFGALARKRREVIQTILFDRIPDFEDETTIVLADDDYLEMIIEEISQTDENGKLEAFTPIVVSVLKKYLENS